MKPRIQDWSKEIARRPEPRKFQIQMRRHRNFGFALLLITITTLALLTALGVQGQELTSRPERGLLVKGTQAVSEIDSVNLQNGSVSLALPLASLPPIAGGKLSYTLSAHYNSKLWNGHSKEEYGTTTAPGCRPKYSTKVIVGGEAGAGWYIGGQYEVFFRNASDDYEYIVPESSSCDGPDYPHLLGGFFKPMLRFPDGSEHEMRIDGGYPTYQGDREHLARYYKSYGATGPTFTSPVRMSTTDGTFLTVIYRPDADPIRWTIYTKDGTRIEQSAVGQRTIDTNGNSILTKLNYTGGYSFARDEHTGREIRWSTSRINGTDVTKVEYQSFQGEWQTVSVVWGKTSVLGKVYSRANWNPLGGETNEGGPCFTHDEFAAYDLPVVREIVLPATSGEPPQKYSFVYNSDTHVETTYTNVRRYCSVPHPSQSYTGTASRGLGELSKITTPLGAVIEYEYKNDDVHMIGPLDESSVDALLASVIRKKKVTHDGQTDTWTYTIDSSAMASGGTVTNPDGSYFSEFYNPIPVWNPNAATDGFGGLQLRADHSGHTRVEKHWTLLGGELFSYGSASSRASFNPVVDTEYTTLLAPDGTRQKMSGKRFLYDYNGELLQTIEYDWFDPSNVAFENNDPNRLPLGIPAQARVLRITNNQLLNQASGAGSDFAYQRRGPDNPAAVILGKPYQTTVGDAASVKRRTLFRYDGLEHGAAPTKGNLTKTSLHNDVTGEWIESATEFSSRGNPVSQTDANGNVSRITYGAINGVDDLYPTRTTQSYGTQVARTSVVEYDFHSGLQTRVTDLDNNVSVATVYDNMGRPIKVRNAAGTPLESWTTTEYSDVHRRIITRSDVETIGDGRKVSTQFYDRLGRVRLSKTLEDPAQSAENETDGIKVETRYRIVGDHTYQLTSTPFRGATAADASAESTMGWTRTKVSGDGRKTEAESFTGAVLPAPWGVNSNSSGAVITEIQANATTRTDQAGKKRRSLTDAIGQLVRVDEPNVAGDLGTVTAPAQPTFYEYSSLGKLIHVQQGVQHRYFMYDSLDRLVRVRQPEQQVNAALKTTTNPGNNAWTAAFVYDRNGNQLRSVDANNVTITTSYDPLNRPRIRSYSDSTPAVTFEYDEVSVPYSKGRLTKVTSAVSESRSIAFDAGGRVVASTQLTDGRSYPSSYKYDLSGMLVEQTYPSGRVVRNFLERDGDISAISGRVASGAYRTYAANLSYAPTGVIKSLQLGNGLWESAQLNSLGQVTELNLGNSPVDGSLWKVGYNYGELDAAGHVDPSRNAGNVVRQTISGAGLSHPFVQTYRYDSLDRITEAKETSNGSQTWAQTFGYDKYGNRTSFSQLVNGQPLQINGTTLPQTDVSTNRFLSGQGYGYDAAGNLTADPQGRAFTFNGDNKQTKIAADGVLIGDYHYDGDGRRVKKITSTETTVFVYDSFGKLVAEMSTAALPSNPTVSYTATDPVGSPRVLTNSRGEVISRRDFMPFGEELTPDPQYRTAGVKYGLPDNVRQKFTGYQRDNESGLDFAEARYYANTHGRFTAIDPLLASGKSDNPQTFNRYVYTMNRPLVFTDPTGLQCAKDPREGGGQYLTVDDGEVLEIDTVDVSVKREEDLAVDIAKVLNAGYQSEQSLLKGAAITQRGEVTKAAIADFADSFSPTITISGSPTGPSGGVTVTIPSPARPLEALFNSAVTLQTQLALNRVSTEVNTNKVLMDADVQYQRNKVGEDEIKASLVN